MWSLKSAKKREDIQPSAVISQQAKHESFELHRATTPLGGAVKLKTLLEWKFMWSAYRYCLTFFSRHILGKNGGKSETALSFTFKTSPLYKSGKWLVRKRPNRCDKLQHTCHRWNASTNAVSTNPSPSILKVYYSTTYLKGNSSKVH